MDITEEAIVTMLLKAGGKVKNSDILSKFQTLLNCEDPVEKKRNRDLFKNIVNSVAVVKELEDGKYVVLKKKYARLLEKCSGEHEESAKDQLKVEYGSTSEDATETVDKVQERSSHFQDGENLSDRFLDTCGNTSPSRTDDDSPILLALQRIKTVDIKPRNSLSFVKTQVTSLNDSFSKGQVVFPVQTTTTNTPKPCALPLRLPAMQTAREPQSPHETEETSFQEGSPPRHKRRPSAEGAAISSPPLRRGCKNSRPSEESKHSTLFPLERNEHDWLVKSAAGQWDQVYGLLLHDAHLAEKSDFMSGFTALHWAVKCGNSNMVTKIIDVSRRDGSGVDVNAKTHGGYTPLHIAALHDQEFIMTLLVRDYGADVRIRDNCGKRAYYYLHKGVSHVVRELLGAPRVPRQVAVVAPENVELNKGHHSTLSRLFQPHVMAMSPKKPKPKLREAFFSVSEEFKPKLREAFFSASEELKPKLREAFFSASEEPQHQHREVLLSTSEEPQHQHREVLYSASEEPAEE